MDRVKSFIGLFSGAVLFWFLFVKRASKPGRTVRRRTLTPESFEYNLSRAILPLRSNGFTLRLVRHLSTTWIGRLLLVPATKRKVHYDLLKNFVIEDVPTYEPVMVAKEPAARGSALDVDLEPRIQPQRKRKEGTFSFATVSDYYHAFRSGEITPQDVAESVMEALEHSNTLKPPMAMVSQYDVAEVYRMARESTERFNEMKPLGAFDGIPVVVKEELAVVPYHLRSGTSFLGRDPATEDSSIVAKLREGGAIIIGVANMHELGMGVLGISVGPSGTARNPYNPQHFTGGSSGGSAACLAAGLCPLAIGSDGGGSIRIPSSACGTVGIKPTQGRVPRTGTMKLCRTVSVVGPMATCVQDVAMLLEFISGEDPQDSATWQQPPLTLPDLQLKSLAGLKIGIDWRHFRDANAEVVAECERAVGYLEEQGAELVGIHIPEVEEMRIAHMVLISTEMHSALQEAYRDNFYDFAGDTATLLGIASTVSAVEYINANKQRTRAIHFIKEIFKQVDVIVTPVSAITSPRIQRGDLTIGVNDSAALLDMIKFSFLANLTGIPGLAVPVGYDARNLPIGLQVMAPWWREDLTLRVGAVAERSLRKKHEPQVFYDVLRDAPQQQ